MRRKDMLAVAILLCLLLVASLTDFLWGKIYNHVVYPGIVAGLGLNALGTLLEIDEVYGTAAQADWYGLVGFRDSALGILACGGVMLVAFVFFAGGVGGGDVKLMAMVGAFLGVSAGLEALLWTLIVGGAMALIVIVWKVGAVELIRGALQRAALMIKSRSLVGPTERERKFLKTPLHLAASALAGVLIVQFELIDWFSP